MPGRSVTLIAALMPLLAPAANPQATKPIWNRHAMTATRECAIANTRCDLLSVASADKSKQLKFSIGGGLIVSAKDGRQEPFESPADWIEVEAMWSPDSKAFSVTGNPNGYTNGTRIFLLTSTGLRAVSLKEIEKDMVSQYPPCVGIEKPEPFCKEMLDGSFYNYATVAWSAPHTAVIMAEVPPTGSYGEHLGQIKGYELNVTTGVITRKMTAREFKARWQSQLAWQVRIPE